MSTKFETLKRDYDMEKNASDCQRVPVSYHPLMHDSENAVSASSVRLGVENSSNEATNDGREGVDDEDDKDETFFSWLAKTLEKNCIFLQKIAQKP
mgnify:CR=1 FL=1